MGTHDLIFKRLLQHFFGDLLRIVVPRVAERVRTEKARFLNPEMFTPRRQLRRVDLLARLDGPEGRADPGLVHVEIEARASPGMGARMWQYHRLLRLHYDLPVLPMVLDLQGGPGPGTVKQTLSARTWGEEVARFHPLVFALAPQPARQFLRRPEPLAWALAALMDPGGWPPERHKLECRRAIARGDLDEQSSYLLEDCVETYLQLEGESKMRYEESMHREGVVPFDEIKMSWSEKIALEATEKGRREEARRLVLRQLERRFGPLAAAVRTRVEAVESLDELERLADRVLDASSLDEMGLEPA